MIAVSIRGANATDAEGLAELRYALRAGGDATESKPEFVRRCREWIAAHLAADGPWQCWVAEADNKLLGAIWLQWIEKIPNPRSEAEHHAYITNFFVHESTRGNGIGTRLLTTAIDWCRDRDVHEIILWPRPRSRSLYERHGFVEASDIMALIINKGFG
ncbi:MAG TPA: GNAT family N-acetyltransferase [Pyrinomonadaceae bacterium]|jgi:GNAT superfamily N-acetyltransferase|nr:GNAT family N-acetyltransferase [Pyrinomonadaceae bacterium]